MAAIPLVLRKPERREINEKDFPAGFFGNYIAEEKGEKQIYTIKQDLLLNNYKSFLAEFYELIEEDFEKYTKLTFGSIPDASSLVEFIEVFNGNNRGNRVPFEYGFATMFSTIGCRCDEYWLFYSGSYKALLEEYTTLAHFEKILAKAMSNPLAKSVKFGIFG